jgi:hypothetical protein
VLVEILKVVATVDKVMTASAQGGEGSLVAAEGASGALNMIKFLPSIRGSRCRDQLGE